jgi:cell division protein FtsI (penicillin-binding protein 3)
MRRPARGTGPTGRAAGSSTARRKAGRVTKPSKQAKPGKAAKATQPDGHSARDRRTRHATELGPRSASFVFRHRTGNAVIFLVLALAAAQLFYLQVPQASGLRAEAAGQLKVTDVQQAMRGDIIDRTGDKLAFTIEARALTFQPIKVGKQLEEAR